MDSFAKNITPNPAKHCLVQKPSRTRLNPQKSRLLQLHKWMMFDRVGSNGKMDEKSTSESEDSSLPRWHEAVLADRLAAFEAGMYQVYDWDIAKERIRRNTQLASHQR